MKYYEYADGNGNRYTVTPSLLTYDPVTPERSSSGRYSGGEPARRNLTPLEYDSIYQLLEKAIHNRSVHISDRIMMSGAITTVKGERQTTVIIKPGCEEQQLLEELLDIQLSFPPFKLVH
jgi:hypothetical protein